jgi:hypothetical protein
LAGDFEYSTYSLGRLEQCIGKSRGKADFSLSPGAALLDAICAWFVLRQAAPVEPVAVSLGKNIIANQVERCQQSSALFQ